jgi:hypothetical protein
VRVTHKSRLEMNSSHFRLQSLEQDWVRTLDSSFSFPVGKSGKAGGKSGKSGGKAGGKSGKDGGKNGKSGGKSGKSGGKNGKSGGEGGSDEPSASYTSSSPTTSPIEREGESGYTTSSPTTSPIDGTGKAGTGKARSGKDGRRRLLSQ